MKRLKIGFLAVIAIAAMSFTVLSHTNSTAKKSVMSNCYADPSLNYLATTPTCGFVLADCSNLGTAIGSFVQKTPSWVGFSDQETCEGSDRLCCIEFVDGGVTNPPCQAVNAFKSDGTIKDFNGNVILAGRYVKIHDIQCKANQ